MFVHDTTQAHAGHPGARQRSRPAHDECRADANRSNKSFPVEPVTSILTVNRAPLRCVSPRAKPATPLVARDLHATAGADAFVVTRVTDDESAGDRRSRRRDGTPIGDLGKGFDRTHPCQCGDCRAAAAQKSRDEDAPHDGV